MITEIAEHSIDLELLPPRANILDLGCRGFEFTKALRELGHSVIPVDIDHIEGGAYYQCAITDYNGYCGLSKSNDPQATKIAEGHEIKCYTLAQFSKDLNIKWWDAIKMDIEGSEYKVIMSMEKAIATQLSIEFHMHCGQSLQEVTYIVERLELLGYEAVSHELSEQHGAGLNYWNSLFILK